MSFSLSISSVLQYSFFIHLAISILLVTITFFTKTPRTKFYPILFTSNFLVYMFIISYLPNYFEFEFIDFLAFLGYSLIFSYIVTIEIPGYVILSKHDSNLATKLEYFRHLCIEQNYDFNPKSLRTNFVKNQEIFIETSLDSITDNFVKRCETIQNLDQTLYTITLTEIGNKIHYVSQRSKHPFPKLIEIFSLAGISFLLGQFLNYIF